MGLNNAFLSLGRIMEPLWAGFTFHLDIQLPYYSGVMMMFILLLESGLWLKAGNPRANVPVPPAK